MNCQSYELMMDETPMYRMQVDTCVDNDQGSLADRRGFQGWGRGGGGGAGRGHY